MKIGAVASFVTPLATGEAMLCVARAMDEAGLDSLWLGEHVMLFDEMEFGYPGSPDGKLPIPDGFGIPDQGTAIAWMASATKTLRFGTSISLISQRNPVYTAKEFATLDWLTGGRIDLGVGVGWCKEEVEASGYTWNDRGARTDEALELMTRLWSEPVVHFDGAHFQVRGAKMHPQPGQQPHVPFIIGGYSDAALRRTARYGNGWLGFGLNPEMTAPMLARLDAKLAEAGRSRKDIEIVMMPMADDEKSCEQFAELGVDRLVPMIGTEQVADANERIRQLERLAARFA